jgi:hypothetical protein
MSSNWLDLLEPVSTGKGNPKKGLFCAGCYKDNDLEMKSKGGQQVCRNCWFQEHADTTPGFLAMWRAADISNYLTDPYYKLCNEGRWVPPPRKPRAKMTYNKKPKKETK